MKKPALLLLVVRRHALRLRLLRCKPPAVPFLTLEAAAADQARRRADARLGHRR